MASLLASCTGLAGCGGDNGASSIPEPDGPDAGFPGVATLHVPSPAWQDQIIYFVMTDRFFDGDPGNNDQGAGEHDPADERKYSGGDLQGVIDQIDYIRDLGATAVWITPPVANQWWDPLGAGGQGYGGYHGYWALNFKQLDPHMGTLETYQDLSRALHLRNMYLVQDIVTNHVGNFFTYVDAQGNDRFDPDDPASNVTFNDGSQPAARPTQPPFDLNDATNPDHFMADIYHWTPNITDYQDIDGLPARQLADLDDLNTSNPVVRQALRDSYGHWIREVGVDAFRVDTVLYVEHDFLHDFLHASDQTAPGVEQAARDTGREDFFTFGEAFVSSPPLTDSGERRAASYLGTDQAPELDAVLSFPLSFTLAGVLAEGKPTRHLAYRLDKAQDPSIYRDPFLVPTFIDNHDMSRFLSRGSADALEQALMVLMTIPGIPVIYYGTEQGFTEPRASMFAAGWGSGGQDHFDRDADLYRYIQGLTRMRKENPVLTRGALSVLQDDQAGPGVIAYARAYAGRTALVILNTADRATLLSNLDTGLPEGTVMTLLASRAHAGDVVIGKGGRVTMPLAAREGLVLLSTSQIMPVAAPEAAVTVYTPIEDQLFTEDVLLTGTLVGPAAGSTTLKLVIDGNLDQAIDVAMDQGGAWSVVMPIERFVPGVSEHTLMLYAPEAGVSSARYRFLVEVEVAADFTAAADDPAGDDTGPAGYGYTLPTDPSFGRQMDIQRIEAKASSSFLEVALTMSEVSSSWTPVNGFDHVLFHIFIDVPGKDGAAVLPRLNAGAPDGLAWDYLALAEGWTKVLYTADGATADGYGTAAAGAPQILVDRDARRIRFLFSAEALGLPATLEGARIYVATWDWNGPDAAPRPLTPEGGQWSFGGGDGAVDPLIIDDTAVIELSAVTP